MEIVFRSSAFISKSFLALILVNVVLENMDAPTMEVVPNVSITSNLENVSLASKEVPINPPRNLCLRIKELTRK